MKFNVNDKVKVKLTNKGKDIYYHQHDELNKFYGKIMIEPRYPKEDEEGYYSDQLWNLMKIFGSHMGNGISVPFETEIILGLEA